MYTNKISAFLLVAGLIAALTAGQTSLSAGQTATGKDRDTAIVLLPLPFEQDSDPISLKTNDDAVWFLFYAQKGQVYSFLFADPEGKIVLKSELYGAGTAPEQSTEMDLSAGKKKVVSCQAKETGNYYLKVILQKNGPFKGKFVYQSGVMKPQS
jgi:hypothetical protein